MMLARNLLAVCVTLALAATASAQTIKLSGENTKLEFVGAKKAGTHTGGFKEVAGAATLKDGAAESLAIEVTIAVDSMYSDDAKLTAHLKSPDFFDAKRFPEAKFVSSKVAKDGDAYKVTGKLTLHGKTEEVTFPATIKTDGGLALKAKFNIERSKWGISYGKGMINEEVEISVAIDAKK